ncbi:hypothetical protein ACFYZE_28390 [Streptomyces sp. NPDC001796]|uniref:hypothetical protein n=1 Tax=Streptomyces sp. NPDC001796 TaxID=3364609 RepID=UPI00369920AD
MFRRTTRGFVIGGALSALAVGVSACSSSSIPKATEAPARASAESADPDHDVWTGEDLSTLLLSVGDLPKGKGYKVQKGYPVNSGTHFGGPFSKPVKARCEWLMSTTWSEASNVGPASYAGSYFANSAQDEYLEEIDSYRSADAWTAMDRLKKYARGCSTFKDTDGSPITVTAATKPLPGPGDDSLEVDMTSDVNTVMGHTAVVSRIGHDIIFSSCTDARSQAIQTAQENARKLATAVKAKTGN